MQQLWAAWKAKYKKEAFYNDPRRVWCACRQALGCLPACLSDGCCCCRRT